MSKKAISRAMKTSKRNRLFSEVKAKAEEFEEFYFSRDMGNGRLIAAMFSNLSEHFAYLAEAIRNADRLGGGDSECSKTA